jgi:hypothetical protein
VIWGGNQEFIEMVLALPPSHHYANRHCDHLFDDYSDPDEDEQEGITETDEEDADVVTTTSADEVQDWID